jgi:hypothetical protein
VGGGAVWIEVRDRSGDPLSGSADSAVADVFPDRFELEAEDLLPENGLANLAAWVAGRSPEPSRYVQEAEDLAWLPSPLRELARRRTDESVVLPVVVAGGERLVVLLPSGLEDVGRLLSVMRRHRVTLIVGTLVRPLRAFADLFDYVVRVRPAPDVERGIAPYLVERSPGTSGVPVA